MKYAYSSSTAIGNITVVEEDDFIVGVSFGKSISDDTVFLETPLIKKTFLQISEYLDGERKIFSLPIRTDGTVFQESVWRFLQQIPYGEHRSYGEIAKAIGHRKASRAVGMACNRNPLPLIIPCHRVISSRGDISGYAWGVAIKRKLLDLESKSTDL